jgi:hypothetical protein
MLVNGEPIVGKVSYNDSSSLLIFFSNFLTSVVFLDYLFVC